LNASAVLLTVCVTCIQSGITTSGLLTAQIRVALFFKLNIQFLLKMVFQHDANMKRFSGWCGWNVSYIFFPSSIMNTADTTLLSIHRCIQKEVYPRNAT